eukprot:gene25058-33570_t
MDMEDYKIDSSVYANFNNYEYWVSAVRRRLLSTISTSSGLILDYEMARRLRLKLKIKSCEDLIRLALFHSRNTSPSAINSTERTAFVALLVEQTDLNRNGIISTKEFHDFLFPLNGSRELGLLIVCARKAFIEELNLGRTAPIAGFISDEDLFESIVHFARRKKVFISPYMGKNLRTKTFQSLLEAIDVLQSNEEVSRVVQVVDIDVDGVISSCELRAWLFPKTLEEYMSTQICLSSSIATLTEDGVEEEIEDSRRNCACGKSSRQGNAGCENQLARVIRNVVLASIDGRSQRERLGQVCSAADQDGLLSRCELRAVLASFFLEHCHRAIREDAAALSAALSAALDPQNSGYIVTDDILQFFFATVPEFDAAAARERILSHLHRRPNLSRSHDKYRSVAVFNPDLKRLILDSIAKTKTVEISSIGRVLYRDAYLTQVDEDAAGLCAQLFDSLPRHSHLRQADDDNNSYIAIADFLQFLWPSETEDHALLSPTIKKFFTEEGEEGDSTTTTNVIISSQNVIEIERNSCCSTISGTTAPYHYTSFSAAGNFPPSSLLSP